MEHVMALVVPSLFQFGTLYGVHESMNGWDVAPTGEEHLPDFLEALESSATPKLWRWQWTVWLYQGSAFFRKAWYDDILAG